MTYVLNNLKVEENLEWGFSKTKYINLVVKPLDIL